MTLRKFCDDWLACNDFSVGYARGMRDSVALLDRFAGGAVALAQLDEPRLNGHLRRMLDDGRSPYTVKAHRANLLILWRRAYDDGLVERLPRRVIAPRCPPPRPRALTVAQVNHLVATAAQTGGVLPRSHVPRAMYFASLFAFAYETGFRLGDMLSVCRGDFVGRRITIVMRKSNRVLPKEITPATMAAVDRLVAVRDAAAPIWGIPFHRTCLYREVRKIARRAGLPGVTMKTLRRTHGTLAHQLEPGNAWRSLGHQDNRTEKYYLDSWQLGACGVQMPALSWNN